MATYWLDANVFIQAKNGPYAFDIAPGFWDYLKKGTADGTLRSPTTVYTEILRGDDALKEWARGMKALGLFVDPGESVQKRFTKIANFVQANYSAPYAPRFLADADPWVIAHAGAPRAVVVTHEKLVTNDCKRVKIPNICLKFGIEYMDTYGMLRQLGVKFK